MGDENKRGDMPELLTDPTEAADPFGELLWVMPIVVIGIFCLLVGLLWLILGRTS